MPKRLAVQKVVNRVFVRLINVPIFYRTGGGVLLIVAKQ